MSCSSNWLLSIYFAIDILQMQFLSKHTSYVFNRCEWTWIKLPKYWRNILIHQVWNVWISHIHFVRFWHYHIVLKYVESQGSSVSIVSDYGLDDRAIGVRSPEGEKNFSSNLCVQTGSDAHPASCTRILVVLSPGQSAVGAWRWPLTPSRAEELYLLSPQAPAGLLCFEIRWVYFRYSDQGTKLVILTFPNLRAECVEVLLQ
jgi:hypothetical protein